MAIEVIFECENEGVLRYSKGGETEFGTAKKKVIQEEGVCFAMSLLWIKRMIQLGEVKSIDAVGNQATFEMIQAAYEKGARGGRSEKGFGTEDERRERLVKAQNLTKHASKSSSSMRSVLKWMLTKSGYYLVNIGSQEGGHALGFKIATGGHYFFDANAGCLKFTGDNEMANWVYAFLFSKTKGLYPEFAGKGGWRDAMLVKLL